MQLVPLEISVFILFLSKTFALPVNQNEPALLVVSYDAFSPEYLNRGITPNMEKFRKQGLSAKYLSNVFPTKTFVNHHTIATVKSSQNTIFSNYNWPFSFLFIGFLSRNTWCIR